MAALTPRPSIQSRSVQRPFIQRPSILKYVYTHNPFYAISAVLMLYATQAAYAKLRVGSKQLVDDDRACSQVTRWS